VILAISTSCLEGCKNECRGPHENYVDRQDAALVRLYAAEIANLHTPYVAPSENGGRGGLRWLALLPESTSEAPDALKCPALVAAIARIPSVGDNIRVWPESREETASSCSNTLRAPVYCPADGLHFSASHYSMEDLFQAKHDHELTPGPCYLHLDGMHMGVGGDDSWTPSVRSPSFELHTGLLAHHDGC
jgi:beta-galactosidase